MFGKTYEKEEKDGTVYYYPSIDDADKLDNKYLRKLFNQIADDMIGYSVKSEKGLGKKYDMSKTLVEYNTMKAKKPTQRKFRMKVKDQKIAQIMKEGKETAIYRIDGDLTDRKSAFLYGSPFVGGSAACGAFLGDAIATAAEASEVGHIGATLLGGVFIGMGAGFGYALGIHGVLKEKERKKGEMKRSALKDLEIE